MAISLPAATSCLRLNTTNLTLHVSRFDNVTLTQQSHLYLMALPHSGETSTETVSLGLVPAAQAVLPCRSSRGELEAVPGRGVGGDGTC